MSTRSLINQLKNCSHPIFGKLVTAVGTILQPLISISRSPWSSGSVCPCKHITHIELQNSHTRRHRMSPHKRLPVSRKANNRHYLPNDFYSQNFAVLLRAKPGSVRCSSGRDLLLITLGGDGCSEWGGFPDG